MASLTASPLLQRLLSAQGLQGIQGHLHHIHGQSPGQEESPLAMLRAALANTHGLDDQPVRTFVPGLGGGGLAQGHAGGLLYDAVPHGGAQAAGQLEHGLAGGQISGLEHPIAPSASGIDAAVAGYPTHGVINPGFHHFVPAPAEGPTGSHGERYTMPIRRRPALAQAIAGLGLGATPAGNAVHPYGAV